MTTQNEKVAYQEIFDNYIQPFQDDVQTILTTLREKIQGWAPEASEKISYGMPTFFLHGNLVHFAAFKNHIGFYPGASGIANFQDRFESYKSSKGAVQFPIEKPLPYDLIEEIVKFRISENVRKAEEKKINKEFAK